MGRVYVRNKWWWEQICQFVYYQTGMLQYTYKLLYKEKYKSWYVNESVSSSGSPFIVMGLLFFVLAFIILVLLLLMLSPSCVDTVFSSSVFSCIC